MMVTVVGAGVSGLTTGVTLAESGMSVDVVSDRPAGATTSAIAGASWGPYLADDPRILRWSSTSLQEFSDRSHAPDSGIRLAPGVEAYDGHLSSIPQWATTVPGYEDCPPDHVPAGYAGAWQYTIPMIDMPRYLDYLVSRFTEAGGRLVVGPALRSLDQITADVIVNCTGLRAGELVADSQLVPIRGQLVVVANPGITEFFQDNVTGEKMTCIFPHGDHVVLGGTSQPGVTSVEWDRTEEAEIIERCTAIDPRLSEPTVIARRIGLRPGRSRVRLEWDERDPRVVHNYGHGGSGVTLSWGCAVEVLRLVRSGNGA